MGFLLLRILLTIHHSPFTCNKILMMKPRSLFRLGLILLYSFSYQAAAAQQNVVAELNSYFNALYRAHQFNGNVLIAEKGKIIYERSFGFADFSAKKPNTKNTSFP